MQTACNKLSSAAVIPDESFSEEIYDYTSELVEKTIPPTPSQRHSPTPDVEGAAARMSDSRIEEGSNDGKGQTNDEEPAADADDAKHYNGTTTAAQGSDDKDSTEPT